MRARLIIGLLSLLPAVAAAQHKPKETGRVGGIAAPPQQVVSPVTVPAPGQFLYANIPVLITPDGRVFADFGMGYEQLVRNCATPLNVYQQSQPVQPATTQPVPNQQTASQQMLNNLPRATRVNSQSCWSTDARGKVMVGK